MPDLSHAQARSHCFSAQLRRLICIISVLCAPLLSSAQLKLVSDPSPKVSAPYQLTTQDGVGLKLIALKADAVVDGPLAFTELRLTFKNPHPRRIEGRFEVTMPDRAALSRFAMKIGGRWMEGEVVEKQAARRAYEDALHRKQDPALLEQDAGNQFRARVFPIMPNEEKELIISWSQELNSASERYTLPLLGLPKIKSLSLRAMVAKRGSAGGVKSSLGGDSARYEISEVTKKNFTPDQDWVITGGEVKAVEGLRHQQLALARVTLPDAQLGVSAPSHMVILFDTSASTMIGFEQRLKRLQSLISKLSQAGVEALSLIAFDQSAQEIFTGALMEFNPGHIKALKTRGALGASSLEVGLQATVKRLAQGTQKGLDRRVLLISDGVYTYGPSSPSALRELVSATLIPQGVTRVDALVEQSARDLSALEAITAVKGLSAGAILTQAHSEEERLNRLKARTFGELQVTVPGAKWTWPSTLKGLQPGDQALIFADLPAQLPLHLTLSGGALTSPIQFKVQAREADEALLERAWVRARIDRLLGKQETQDPDMKGVIQQQIIKLSTEHRVLSPYTALVVLENEAMYRRFGIDRRALSDILVVSNMGIERQKRTEASIPAPPPPPKPVRRPRRSQKKKTRRAPTRAAQEAPIPPASAPLLDAPAPEPTSGAAPADLMEPEPSQAAMERSAPPPPDLMAEADEQAPASEPSLTMSATGLGGGGIAVEREPPRARGRRAEARPRPIRARRSRSSRREAPEPPRSKVPALKGVMAVIEGHLSKNKAKSALKAALKWQREEPLNVLTYIGLGKSYRATGDLERAARAYGSVIDFYPSRADMRRFAGNWLETLDEAGLELAIATYQVAMEQRGDHPSVYHMLAMALSKVGRYEEALRVALTGITARRASGRFARVEQILQEDAQLIASAWLKSAPKRAEEIKGLLASHSLSVDARHSVRFVLSWETDANDVDFHIYDAKGDHASYRQKHLASGGELYADITSGYGPECFTIYDPSAAPYSLQAHYYSQGPMGYGSGKLQTIAHDGKGELTFTERPFVIMNNQAFVDLGKVKRAAIGSGAR